MQIVAHSPALVSPHAAHTNMRATDPQYTFDECERLMRPAFNVLADMDARAALREYANACGRDAAAQDMFLAGQFLPDEEAMMEAKASAALTLRYGCTSDDPRGFLDLYTEHFHIGYLAYVSDYTRYDA